MILTLKLRLYTCRLSQLQETVGVWVCEKYSSPMPLFAHFVSVFGDFKGKLQHFSFRMNNELMGIYCHCSNGKLCLFRNHILKLLRIMLS